MSTMWRPYARWKLASRVLNIGKIVPVAEQRRWESKVKITKTLQKMLDRKGGSKKKGFFGPVNVYTLQNQDADLSPIKKPLHTEGQRRRAHQVGRVLYDNIVHLVNSGELSLQLVDLSVEIVQVKVVPNFSAVNVYWLASGSEEDEKVEKLLKQNEGLLRQLLTSYHVLGNIPRICFVRDNSRALYQAVETLLSKADFGPDFTPTRLDTSIRDRSMWAQKMENASPVIDLQTQFDQLSFKENADSDMMLQTKSRMEGRGSYGDTGENELCGKVSEAVSFSPLTETGGVAVERTLSDTTERQSQKDQDTLYSDPSSDLDKELLCDKFLSNSEATSGNIKQPDTLAAIQEERNTKFEGFRDDIYGVPQSELFSKILNRKQKAGTRPVLHDHMKEVEASFSNVEVRNLKLLLQKKTKGRLTSQSDYQLASIDQFHENDDDSEKEFLSSHQYEE